MNALQKEEKCLISPGRFWPLVATNSPDACWLWQGAIDPNGYGRFSNGRGFRLGAHRVAYYLSKGPIKHQVLHSCDNPPCCNPAHLRDGTQKENFNEMLQKGHLPKYKTPKLTCKRGHSYTPENTYARPDGFRECRACMAIRRLY